MVLHVVDALAELPLERIVVVVGHGAEHVTKTLQEQLVTEVPVEFVEQRVQRGTGDAVSVALTVFDDLDAEDDILVLPGDAPLVRAETIARLATEHRVQDAAASILTAAVAEPIGPRAHRARQGRPRVAASSSTPTRPTDEREIDEINTSIYCFRRGLLAPALRRLSPENAQGEYYLTDAIGVLRDAGHKVIALAGRRSRRSDHGQRPRAARRSRGRAARPHQPGVDASRRHDGRSRRAPTSTRRSRSSPTSRLLPGTILEGRTVVGTGSVIGPDCHLTDVVVGEGVRMSNTVARRVRDRRRLRDRAVRVPAPGHAAGGRA